uniref:Centromere protein O n=1 Tax=Leptobrachium leishanense TaxID=445787 RepID=A0A8C5N102_9ANUR
MDEAQTFFREGVMVHLEELETLSHKLALRQEQKRQDRETLEGMKETLIRLRKERDELLAKVSVQEAKIHSLTTQNQPGSDSQPTAETRGNPDAETLLEEVKGILQADWLTGISGKLTRRGACICISTAFEGKYLDSYYLDLVLGSNPRIERHSIPAFIPLDQIANTHLQADLKKFLVLLFQHLNAYAGRKYQAEQLQALPLIATPGTLQKNSLYTLLTFEYNLDVEGADVCFCAKVLYGDLTRVLPTEVHITCKDPAQSLTDTISSHSKLFYKKPLHQALDYLKSANETLVHTSASLSGAGLF